MAGVALCAIDGLLVWRVLGLVTSTLRFCGFPKAGLPSCSAPFSRGSASVLLSPPGGLFSVLPAQLPKSIKTDLPSSSALHLLSCAPPFWRIWAAERPKWTTRERKGQRPTASSRVIRLACLCAHRNMDVIIPPHPTPPPTTPPHPP